MKRMELVATTLISIIAGSMIGYAFSCWEVSELQSEISTLSSGYDDLNSVHHQLEINYTSLQSEASTCVAELNNLTITYEELSDGYGNLTERYSELNATCEALSNDYNNLNQSHGNLNQRYLDLNTTYEALSDDCDSLNQSYSDLQQAYEQLEERVNCTCILGVHFSPGGECEAKVIEWIEKANETIRILIYSFTLDSISPVLIDAKDRGIDVRIVFEKSQIIPASEYHTLRDAGVPVRNDTNSAAMHHKVMIIDNTAVLTGSFNWSARGQEDNDENLVIIRDEVVAQSYSAEFTRVWEAACPVC